MTGLLGAARLRALLDEHGVRPRKELGQNFVVDPNTIRKVVDAASVGPGDLVVEVGAGAGSLTLGLVAAGANVVALEFDRSLVPVLEETVAGVSNVTVVEVDALGFDFESLGAASLVANLPYNIAVPVVMKVLSEAPDISPLTVMTQREVGERMVANPGSKSYGRVSVMVRYVAAARIAGHVSRRAFYPVPSVDSVLVRMERRAEPGDLPWAALDRVVRAAFGHRRKTLRNTLAALAGGSAAAEAWIEAAGMDPSRRAEEIDVDGFVALARSAP